MISQVECTKVVSYFPLSQFKTNYSAGGKSMCGYLTVLLAFGDEQTISHNIENNF